MDKREPLQVPVPLWLPEEALEHYRDLVVAIGAVWTSGQWWLPFYKGPWSEVMMPMPLWLSARRAAAETLNEYEELQLTEDRDLAPEARRPVVLDDTQVIEKGPDGAAVARAAEGNSLAAEDLDKDRARKEAAAADAIADTYPDGQGVAEIEAEMVKPDPEQMLTAEDLDKDRQRKEALTAEDLEKNRQRKEALAAAAAAGINTPYKPCPDPEPDARPAAPVGHDHAEGRPQTGIVWNPDPTAAGSGLKASQIAEIAYNAVQQYKRVIGQDYIWFDVLSLQGKDQITGMVADFLRGKGVSAAAMHERWKANRLAAGITVEQDPHLGQSWLEMDPGADPALP